MADDLAAGRLAVSVEAELIEDLEDDPLVVLGLLEVFLPLFLELAVLGAADGGLVDLLAAEFGLERLVQAVPGSSGSLRASSSC